MAGWTTNNQRFTLNYLISAGLSAFGAAALVSRWTNVESGGQGSAAVNPSSGAFGIAQWLGARKAGIAGDTDLSDQLAYVVQELNSSESRAGNVLRSANDAYTGAVGASMYERAEGYNATTGVDNFTNRTAAGIPAILALADGTNTQTDDGASVDNANPQPQNDGIGTIILILLGLYAASKL